MAGSRLPVEICHRIIQFCRPTPADLDRWGYPKVGADAANSFSEAARTSTEWRKFSPDEIWASRNICPEGLARPAEFFHQCHQTLRPIDQFAFHQMWDIARQENDYNTQIFERPLHNLIGPNDPFRLLVAADQRQTLCQAFLGRSKRYLSSVDGVGNLIDGRDKRLLFGYYFLSAAAAMCPAHALELMTDFDPSGAHNLPLPVRIRGRFLGLLRTRPIYECLWNSGRTSVSDNELHIGSFRHSKLIADFAKEVALSMGKEDVLDLNFGPNFGPMDLYPLLSRTLRSDSDLLLRLALIPPFQVDNLSAYFLGDTSDDKELHQMVALAQGKIGYLDLGPRDRQKLWAACLAVRVDCEVLRLVPLATVMGDHRGLLLQSALASDSCLGVIAAIYGQKESLSALAAHCMTNGYFEIDYAPPDTCEVRAKDLLPLLPTERFTDAFVRLCLRRDWRSFSSLPIEVQRRPSLFPAALTVFTLTQLAETVFLYADDFDQYFARIERFLRGYSTPSPN